MELLQENNYNVIVVANKMDKVKKSELAKKKKAIIEKLNLPNDGENVVYFSTKTKKGKRELLEKIFS
jgi:GTP-binding protein EngB required for normal cell division